MFKVLIVEDEPEILSFLKPELVYEGYEVDTAEDGRNGLLMIEKGNYDIILLDIMLPLLNGLEVCRRARKFTQIPIIMLTARDNVMDKVTGLDTGADDYITKPFSIEELLARMRCALRKINPQKYDRKILSLKNISLDQGFCEVKVENEIIELTKKEYQLLEFFLINKNNVLSREQILDGVWGHDYFGDTNVIDVYIRYLRVKLGNNDNEKYITTVRGLGYIMKDS